MSVLKIENENYYHALIVALGVLLLFNITISFMTQNGYGLIPIGIQLLLLFLLLTKHTLSQLVIKVWIIITFFVAQVLKIFGVGLITLGSTLKNEDTSELLTSNSTIFSLVFIIIGMILWILNANFGIVSSQEEI